jgi:hypothetical protein
VGEYRSGFLSPAPSDDQFFEAKDGSDEGIMLWPDTVANMLPPEILEHECQRGPTVPR